MNWFDFFKRQRISSELGGQFKSLKKLEQCNLYHKLYNRRMDLSFMAQIGLIY